MMHSYRTMDLTPDKCGVDPIEVDCVNEFKPWYYDGSTVWWGKRYKLRSEAEEAALNLKREVSKVSGFNIRQAEEEQCQARRKA